MIGWVLLSGSAAEIGQVGRLTLFGPVPTRNPGFRTWKSQVSTKRILYISAGVAEIFFETVSVPHTRSEAPKSQRTRAVQSKPPTCRTSPFISSTQSPIYQVHSTSAAPREPTCGTSRLQHTPSMPPSYTEPRPLAHLDQRRSRYQRAGRTNTIRAGSA
jgi:hypothetical protein